jgi:hypothetical protein
LLLADGVLDQYRRLIDEILNAATMDHPLLIFWHTFESPKWRPVQMSNNAPGRKWMTPVVPVPGPLTASPYVSDNEEGAVSYHCCQISFLITKTRVITAAPGGGSEAHVLAGATSDDLMAAWY